MAVPVFGPIALDEVPSSSEWPPRPAIARPRHAPVLRRTGPAPSPAATPPIKLLIITGDNVGPTTGRRPPRRSRTSSRTGGRIKVDVTTTPAEGPDRREPREVRRAPAQLQGHRQGPPETQVVRREQGGVPEGREGRARGWSSSTSPRPPSPSRTGRSSRRPSPAAGGPRASTARARVHRQEDRRQAPDLRGPARRSSST